MLEEILGIYIFTYNRSDFLSRTLSQLANSPFKSCSITVLDNDSTDRTPEVCREFASRLPRLKAIRHRKNIGGLANYLRAVEMADAAYTWILCDDDTFDFGKAQDLIEAVVAGAYDVVSVGVEGHDLPGGYKGRLAEFAMAHCFFLCHSFVPSLIFRTALFTPSLIRAGYDNVDTMFPHFPFLCALVEGNASICVSQNKIIKKSNNLGYSTFRFLSGWIKSCDSIQERQIRQKCLNEVFSGVAFWKNLIYCCLTERTFRPATCLREFKELVTASFLVSPMLAGRIVIFIVLILGPESLHRFLWGRYKRYRESRGIALPEFDETR